MVVVRDVVLTSKGLQLMRGIRVMSSPFSESGGAIQNVQPWVGHPAALSSEQLRRTSALTSAATGAKGTFGTTINPRTGRPMPAIAAKVRDTISGKLSPSEKLARRRAAYTKRIAAKHATPQYQAYLLKLRAAA